MEPEIDPRIEDVLDHVGDAFASLGPGWRYLHANGNALRMMGRTKEALIGRTLWDVFPESVGSAFGSACEAVMNGGCVRTMEMHYPAHDQWMVVRVFPLRAGIGLCYFDLAHSEQGAQELARAREELVLQREHNEERSTFMAMASHEFRTPLSAVLTSVDLLAHYEAPEHAAKRIKHTGTIRASVHTMMDILNDLLSLERLEEGAVKPARVPLDLRHYCDELLEQVAALRKPGQVFAFEHIGDREVLLDPGIMGHVLLNLISNAIKYSDQEIRIRSAVTADRIRFEVTDRGIGIPLAEQERLFSRFFRASNARAFKGTGLGLTIALRYARLLGGAVGCTSVPGRGTTFTVDLPRTAD